MKLWMIILISIIGLIILLYIIVTIIIGNLIFKRMKNEVLLIDVLNLEKTHYAPYIDFINTNMREFMAIPYQELMIKSYDNCKLYGKYYDNHSNKTIIFFHGYHADAYNNAFVVGKKLLDEGYNLLLVDERAHGKSGGHFTTFGVKESFDALAWIDYINKLFFPESIGLWGMSMGCSTIERISDRLPLNCKAMVLDSGFTGAYEEIKYSLKRKHIPSIFMFGLSLFTVLICHFKLDKQQSIKSLQNTNIPAFFIHGTVDNLVPYDMGCDCYDACNSVKSMLSPECGHVLSHIASKEEIENEVYPFLKKYLI